MKRLLMITLLVAGCGVPSLRAVEDVTEGENKEGKVNYALILPEEKTFETVKGSENNPFGGLVNDKTRDVSSAEDAKVSEILRSLSVNGKSSRNTVLLGDIILRRGEMVPEILPNQTVQLKVQDITQDHVELVFIERKPTGLPPRTLTLYTDVSPQVKLRLPGGGRGITTKRGGDTHGPMGVIRKTPLIASDTTKSALRAEPVAEEATNAPPPSSAQPASTGSSLLNLFFGKPGQAKETTTTTPGKPAEDEDQKQDHAPKP